MHEDNFFMANPAVMTKVQPSTFLLSFLFPACDCSYAAKILFSHVQFCRFEGYGGSRGFYLISLL